MVAVMGEMIEVGGVQVKLEAVELVRRGYRRVYAKLEEARSRGTAREVTKLADIIRSVGPVAVPPLLTDEERVRFEELTNTYLSDRLVHMIWVILENDLNEHALGPATMPIRGAEHPGTEVRLVHWW